MTGQFPPAPPRSERNDSHDPEAARVRIDGLRAVLAEAKRRAAERADSDDDERC